MHRWLIRPPMKPDPPVTKTADKAGIVSTLTFGMATEPRAMNGIPRRWYHSKFRADAGAGVRLSARFGRACRACTRCEFSHLGADRFPGEVPIRAGVTLDVAAGGFGTSASSLGSARRRRRNERFPPICLYHGQRFGRRSFDMPSRWASDSSHPRSPRGRARGRGDRFARRYGNALRGIPMGEVSTAHDESTRRGDHARLLRRSGEHQGVPPERWPARIQPTS